MKSLALLLAFGLLARADTFHATKRAEMDAAISLAISDGRCPGGVLWLEREGAADQQSFGERGAIRHTHETGADATFCNFLRQKRRTLGENE